MWYQFKYGVIYPVDLDTDLGKLKHNINIENGVQVVKIERLNSRKNGETLPSPTLKLAFNDNCLPVSISIGIFSYRFDPLCLTHCSASSVNELDVELAVARLNNAVCVVVKEILEMTVQLKHLDVQDAKVSTKQTHVSVL